MTANDELSLKNPLLIPAPRMSFTAQRHIFNHQLVKVNQTGPLTGIFPSLWTLSNFNDINWQKGWRFILYCPGQQFEISTWASRSFRQDTHLLMWVACVIESVTLQQWDGTTQPLIYSTTWERKISDKEKETLRNMRLWVKRKEEMRGGNGLTGRDRDDDRRGAGNGEGDKQWVSGGEELIINDWNVLKDRKSPKKTEMWREIRQIKTDDYRKRQGNIRKGAS